MTPNDEKYIQLLIADKVLKSPCLELGAAYGGRTCREMITADDLIYYSTDIQDGSDFVVNFEDNHQMKVFDKVGPFGSILVLNILEHTYNPIKILDNFLTILDPNGVLVVITPTFWQLHNYPIDTWRINPNFYEQYAKKNHLEIIEKYFQYPGFGLIKEHVDEVGNYVYPRPTSSFIYDFYSRFVHKVFNTFGRGMSCPSQFATGVVFKRILA